MALAEDFARQFTNPKPTGYPDMVGGNPRDYPGLYDPYRRASFWQEGVTEGSISRTKTARASEEMKSTEGEVFWTWPGATTMLKAMGWTQLSTGVKPETGPSPEERRLAQQKLKDAEIARAAKRPAPPIGF